MNNKIIFIIGISSGVIASIWSLGSTELTLSLMAGFLAWSTFFAAGGGKKGLKTAWFTNVSGVCWGFLTTKLSILLSLYINPALAGAIATGICSACMCWQSRIKLFSFIPGTFIGSTAFFASSQNFTITAISMVVGGVLGYVSENFTGIMAKYFKVEE